jgi:ABC-type branched-subunit amino acid transport system permease subunit
VPAWLAAVVCVGGIAPLLGVFLSLLAGRLAHVSSAKRIIATVGVLLTIQGLIQLRYGVAPLTLQTSLPSGAVRLGGTNVGYDQLVTTAIALLGVGALGALFRFSRLGLQMRAVVDNDELLGLAGQTPAKVRAQAWMIGSSFAALSGILLAPTVGLDALVLTFVVVQAFGAAAVGRFERTLTTFVAAVLIGIVQNLLNAPRVQSFLPVLRHAQGLDQAVPFLVLFGVLVLTPTGAFRARDPRRPHRSNTSDARSVQVGVATLAVLAGAAVPFVAGTRIPVYTLGAVFVIVYASLFLLIEVSNQVSLCHVAFVALGATTFCHLTTGAGLPWLLGVLGAGLVAVPVGAIVAIPAIRLSGLFLALATLGFGVLVEKLLYVRGFMFGSLGARTGARPAALGLDTGRGYYYLCLGVAIAAVAIVLVIRRSRLGRLLNALADSPVALVTHGCSTSVTRVLVFCISAAMAGVAGALYVGVVGSVSRSGASTAALVSFNSLVWVVILAFVGRNLTVAPVLAAFILIVGPSYNTSPDIGQYLTIGFGILAVLSAAFGDAVAARSREAIVAGATRSFRSPVRERASLEPELVRG